MCRRTVTEVAKKIRRGLLLSVGLGHLAREHPLSASVGREILRPDPSKILARVSPSSPTPQRFPDRVVHEREGFAADHVPVVENSTPDQGIEEPDQRSGRDCFVGLDDLPDLAQEGAPGLLGRLDEQLALVFTYRLTQEVKARFYMRDGRFLRRELQPSLSQKLLKERSDLIFEYLFRVPGDDEVVGLCRTPSYAARTWLRGPL